MKQAELASSSAIGVLLDPSPSGKTRPEPLAPFSAQVCGEQCLEGVPGERGAGVRGVRHAAALPVEQPQEYPYGGHGPRTRRDPPPPLKHQARSCISPEVLYLAGCVPGMQSRTFLSQGKICILKIEILIWILNCNISNSTSEFQTLNFAI